MSQSNELIVALGARKFSINAPFGPLPQGCGKVTDVACNADGTVFVLTRRDCRIDPVIDSVYVFTSDGSYLSSWGGDRIADAHKINIDRFGRVWIVDRDAHEVIGFDQMGTELMRLGQRNTPLAPFNHPSDIAFLPDGKLVVCDGYAAGKVHVFTADGLLLHSFGEVGRDPGQFLVPHGIDVFADGTIAVADRENGRVQIFEVNGTFRRSFDFFFRPMDVWVAPDDTLYVSDNIPTFTHMTAQGEVLGRCRTTLNGPHGFTGSVGGQFYMAENNPSRITQVYPL